VDTRERDEKSDSVVSPERDRIGLDPISSARKMDNLLVPSSSVSVYSNDPIRIVSLIPSATDIVCILGLQDFVVGITHCCDLEGLPSSVVVVTEDQIHAACTSQADIDAKVNLNAQMAEMVLNSGSLLCPVLLDNVPSLYPIHQERLQKAAPTVILTQDLCDVCAPSSLTVLWALEKAGIQAKVVLLSPSSLTDVIENVQQVADAVGISERGRKVCEELQSNFTLLQNLIQEKKTKSKTRDTPPRLLLMEWVDPPFCGGHWIMDMARLVGAELAMAPHPDGRSRRVTWTEIEDADPDFVIVACCGFDLERNLADATMVKEKFASLKSTMDGNLFAANGDQYFARPSPKLLTGAIIMALCIHNERVPPFPTRENNEWGSHMSLVHRYIPCWYLGIVGVG
jgi:iron complex transport system substrate-binding protein